MITDTYYHIDITSSEIFMSESRLSNIEIYGSRFRQFPPELMSIQVLNPYTPHDSQSRQTMFASHISQTLQVSNATPRFDPTGMEPKYGEYTFKVEMPVDGHIRECISKYPPMAVTGGVEHINPLTTVIYEYPVGNGLRGFGSLNIEAHHSMHQYFGFRYKPTAAGRELRPGQDIPKGTVFARSPTINEEGDWMYGFEANVCVMTVPGVTEDGMVARRGYLEKMKVKAYGTRRVNWGKTHVPLNMYGDDQQYKIFPDIGETIRDDGIIFALRPFNMSTAVMDMHKEALKQTVVGDKPTYIETNAKNAKVINVEVYKGRKNTDRVTLSGMDVQCERYYERTKAYHRKLLDTYERLRRENGRNLVLTPELTNLIARAQELYDKADGRTNHMYMWNDAPLEEWSAIITYEYELTPTVGFKITGGHGDKVVIVEIWDDEDMPIDDFGVRADFIQDPDGTNRRMNLGRLYQHEFKAMFREVGNHFLKMWGTDKSPENTIRSYNYLLDFYRIISPKFAELAIKRYGEGANANALQHLIKVERFVRKYNHLRIWMPVDTPISYYDAYLDLRQKYPINISPVTYRPPGCAEPVRTYSSVMISSMYLMMLEKIGNGWSAVASAKVQHYDIPAKVSSADKYSTPGKQSPGRITGEGEVRLIYFATGTGEFIAELFDQNTNRRSHAAICNRLLTCPQPTNQRQIIDRKLYPRKGGMVIDYLSHMTSCAGFKFERGDASNANKFERHTTYQY